MEEFPNIQPGKIQDFLGGRGMREVLKLAEAAVMALAVAGSEPEWDSETIEWVLTPLQDAAAPLGVPPVGIDSEGGLRFWAELAGNERTLDMLDMLAEGEGA